MNRFIIILSVLTLFSCSVQQDISLEIDKSGVIKTDIQLHDMLTAFFKDSAELDDEVAKYLSSEVREEEMNASFINNPDLDLVTISWKKLNALSLEMKFKDPAHILPPSPDENGKDVISYYLVDNKAVLNIFIDINNFSNLLGLFPLLQDMDMLYFFPDPESPLTEDEYVEFVSFTFAEYIGEDDPDEAIVKVGDILRKAQVILNVKGDKGIVYKKKTGCAESVKIERINRRHLKVMIPLLTLLTLEKPVDVDFVID